FALPGLVGLGLATDRRWSSARTLLQAQDFSIALILIAAVRAWDNFDPVKNTHWLFVGGLSGLLIGIIVLHVWLDRRRTT
ncbi:MAG TPA: hypothetical protein VFF59_06965, partial [Anaerolineae bacterium]|nr:hypothetical protein [Anaerolineae bacterium]